MAANYWDSTQRKYWTFTKKELADIRRGQETENNQMVSQYPLPDKRLLNIYFSHQLGKMAKRMSVRQQALATAQVYMRRFYTKREIRQTNPYLVLSTAFYLACKMEECPQHIRIVVGEARQFWPEAVSSDVSKLGECEFHLISEMNSQLIIHHPYRDLTELQALFSLSSEETSLAWSIVNDHFLTDLPLLYPPHVIAITAVFLSVVLKPSQGGLQSQNIHNAMQQAINIPNAVAGTAQTKVQKLLNWLADSSVSIEALIDCTQELISLYEIWEQFNDKNCKESIMRFVFYHRCYPLYLLLGGFYIGSIQDLNEVLNDGLMQDVQDGAVDGEMIADSSEPLDDGLQQLRDVYQQYQHGADQRHAQLTASVRVRGLQDVPAQEQDQFSITEGVHSTKTIEMLKVARQNLAEHEHKWQLWLHIWTGETKTLIYYAGNHASDAGCWMKRLYQKPLLPRIEYHESEELKKAKEAERKRKEGWDVWNLVNFD